MSPMAQLDERFVGPLEGETVGTILKDALTEPDTGALSTPEPTPYITTDGPVLSLRLRRIPTGLGWMATWPMAGTSRPGRLSPR